MGRLHQCAGLIDSWHRKGDTLMDGRQLPAPDASSGIRKVTGEGTRKQAGVGVGKQAWDITV